MQNARVRDAKGLVPALRRHGSEAHPAAARPLPRDSESRSAVRNDFRGKGHAHKKKEITPAS